MAVVDRGKFASMMIAPPITKQSDVLEQLDARTAKNEQTNAVFERVLMAAIVALLIAEVVLGVYGVRQLL